MLAADPTTGLQAATKQYVDTKQPLGGPYLPLTGGNISGALSVGTGLYAMTNTLSGVGIFDDVTSVYFGFAGGYAFGLNKTTNLLSWIANSAAVVTIDTGGNLITSGSLYADSGNIRGAWIRGINSVGIGADGTQQMYQDANTRYNAFSVDWFWGWATATGQLNWFAGSFGPYIAFLWVGPTGSTAANWAGSWYGAAAYLTGSDESLKTDIQQSPYGLESILKINPIRFTRISKEQRADKAEVGFSAQNLLTAIPEAVTEMVAAEKPHLAIMSESIVAALVNAVKELCARVVMLETKLATT